MVLTLMHSMYVPHETALEYILTMSPVLRGERRICHQVLLAGCLQDVCRDTICQMSALHTSLLLHLSFNIL